MARRHEFVASRNDRRAHFAADFDFGKIPAPPAAPAFSARSCSPACENFLAFAQIPSAAPDKFPGRNLRVHDNLSNHRAHIFLHDRLRPRLGIGAPVKMRTASPARDMKLPIDSRRLFANDAQTCSRPAVARHHGITIHRGIIENRQRQAARKYPRAAKPPSACESGERAGRQGGHALEDFRAALLLRVIIDVSEFQLA